ncbi:MAG: VTT domain-containing protein, partial [Oscillospiraceae bacterium]
PLPFAVLLNTAGMAIMVSTPYLIGRSLGPPIVSRLREKYPKLQVMERLPVKNGRTFSFLLRLLGLPLIPVSLYLGAKECPYRKYLSGSVLGLFPITLCATVLGTAADTPGSPAFRIALSVHVLCCLSSLLGFWLIQKKTGKAEEKI